MGDVVELLLLPNNVHAPSKDLSFFLAVKITSFSLVHPMLYDKHSLQCINEVSIETKRPPLLRQRLRFYLLWHSLLWCSISASVCYQV